MDRPSPDIPLLLLEPSLSAQDSVSAQNGPSSHRPSHETVTSANTISDASEAPKGAGLPPCSAEENEAALDEEPESPKSIFQIFWRWISRRFPEGWRLGTLVGTILSLCVLVGNVLVLVIVSSSVDSTNSPGSTFTTVREGSCSDIENIQLGIHLVINAFSTLLLGASNYCMQCLSAPTRSEVDGAHKQGRYLDIGVPSLRNLRFIKRGRLTCWLLLGLSSLPLHLVYNSTFFVSLTNNSYDIYFASHSFQNGKSFDRDLFPDRPGNDVFRNTTVHLPNGTTSSTLLMTCYKTHPSEIQESVRNLGVKRNGSVFEKLDNADCIDAYARTTLPDRRTLILVSSTTPLNNHQLGNQSIYDGDVGDRAWGNCSTSRGVLISGFQVDRRTYPTQISCLETSSLYTIDGYRSGLFPQQLPVRSNWFFWICSQMYDYDDSGDDIPPLCGDGHWETLKSNASQWTVYGFEIDYCISERVEHGCKLNMAGRLLMVVIAFNAMKVVIMGFVVWRTHDEQIITIGDAAASFIQKPDPATKGLCLYSREYFYLSLSGTYKYPIAKLFESEPKRRATAATRRRWMFSTILVTVGLGTILGLLVYAINDLKANYGVEGFRSLWDLGLGTLNGFTLINGWYLPTSGDTAVVSAVLVANSPQALFSMLYLLMNSLFTSLSLAAEWSRYANRSTALRVSKQCGDQRSTYFLQVPYRLAIPLMGLSAFLHWIMSQSIFFTQVEAKDSTGVLSDFKYALYDGATTCSYSPLGMIITVVAGFSLMAFAVALGWRKLQSGIPVAGSCSAAISAACHCPEGTSELLPIMWGVIPDMREQAEDGELVGHCAFSNGPVDPPIEGNLYA